MNVDPITGRPVQGVGGAGASAPAKRPGSTSGPAFGDLLQRELATQQAQPLRFSGHALERLQRRSIDVDGPVGERLAEGVARAAAKGARDSVVLVDGTAFVVSVRNRTVITAVDEQSMKQHVFTNIDSAVIA